MHRAFDRGDKHKKEHPDSRDRSSSAPPNRNKTNSANSSLRRGNSLHRDNSMQPDVGETKGDDGVLADRPSDRLAGGRTKGKTRATISGSVLDRTSSSTSSLGGGGGIFGSSGNGNGTSGSGSRFNRAAAAAAPDPIAIGVAGASQAASASLAAVSSSNRSAAASGGGGASGGAPSSSPGLYARIGHVLRKSFNGITDTTGTTGGTNAGVDNINARSSLGVPADGSSEKSKGQGLGQEPGPGSGAGQGLGPSGQGSGQGRRDRISSRSAPSGMTRLEQDHESSPRGGGMMGGGLNRRDGTVVHGESRKGSSQILLTSSAKYSNKKKLSGE